MNAANEWIGGIASMSGWITGEEGEDYRPDILLWMDTDNGAVLGFTTERPENLLALAAARLQAAMLRPMVGAPARPTRLRVASEPLAAVLGEAFPDIDIVVAPTPEIDSVMQAMTNGMTDSRKEHCWYSGAGERAIGRFFDAAADLYEAAPWEKVPDDACLLYMRLPALGPHEHVVSVIGQRSESHGFVVFDDRQDYDRFAEMAAADESPSGPPSVPRHAALSFDRGADVPRGLRQEIIRHGWRVTGESAYPSILQVEPDLTTRPMSDSTVVQFEALARALVVALGDAAPWQHAWEHGELYHTIVSVETSEGIHEVDLCTEPTPELVLFEGSDEELLTALDSMDLSTEPSVEELDRLVMLENSLLKRFEASEEAAQLHVNAPGVALVIDHAAPLFRVPITRLTAFDLEEILFDIVPSKVNVPASEATAIINSLRAGYRWMLERHPLPQVKACLAMLDDNAEARFETELANEANYDPGKAMMMAGIKAGFDMTTQEGINAFMSASHADRLGYGPPDVDMPPRNPELERKQKSKRKASRKSAKKSRRRNR